MKLLLRIILSFLLFYIQTNHAASLQKTEIDLNPPPLELKDLSGQWHKLEQFKGQVVLINFWGSWCRTCVEEMPALQRLEQDLAKQGLVILAVNVNQTATAIRRFIKGMSLDLTVLKDSKATTAKQWQVDFYPSSFIIDRKGKLRYTVLGTLNWTDAEIKKTIQLLLNESK